jgi:hypothetical protein
VAKEEDRSFIGAAVGNSGCAAVAGCLWFVAALWLLPGIWIGLGYGYNFSEWLSLLPYPAESEEVLPWLGRIIPLAVLVCSTLFLGAFALRSATPTDEQ